ncbi:MAG TPA: tetratricopeptide repeat protein [Opitutaceae bacterium]|jgi:tetratricopeptide (TPR) repeat protein|nr:tetratricopeptide repeat protein [Opitutaceae bacterium]
MAESCSSNEPAEPAGRAGSRWIIVLAGGFLALAGIAAYSNSFSGPFLLDDMSAIVQKNATIRHLWPVWPVLSPPGGLTVSGRPVLNLSLAVNYAFGGTQVGGYHGLNLAIHILAGLALFGIVRRTLLRPVLRERFGAAALPLALAVTALWTLHPLQTEAVTYVIQRAESLMGLFYLLTIYAFIRGAESPKPLGWYAGSILACLLGMATKEVMVSAPLMVLLYDRTFVAGSFREACRQRWRFYLGLAGTWLLLGYLLFSTGGNRNGTIGFNVGVAWWAYGLTQFEAVVRYLQLSLWPHPLIFEYGTFWVKQAGEVIPSAIIVILLIAGTVVALWRKPGLGFLGAWFFVMLAPTSLVPGTTQMIVEHRMYLSLAAVVVLVVLGIFSLAGRRSLAVFLALAAGLGWATSRRNEDYRSEVSIWSDAVAKRPGSERAQNSLAVALFQAGRTAEAMAHGQEALRLQPDDPEAHFNMGTFLAGTGRLPEAVVEYENGLRLNADDSWYSLAMVHYGLGFALFNTGRTAEAIEHFQESLRLQPDYAEARFGLGNALASAGRQPEAMVQYEEAIRLKPDYPEARTNLGDMLCDAGKMTEGIAQYEEALRLRPDYLQARFNLGVALASANRWPEAVAQFAEAVRLKPDSGEAHYSLGNVLREVGRLPEAIGQYEQTIRLQPDFAEAYANLGAALGEAGRLPEAIAACEQALKLDPSLTRARDNLEQLRAAKMAP